ncbi:MAG: DUF1015 family protein [Candidatus Limnocylindrales bacterium]
MPTLRPFRALRYDPAAVGDVADVLSPPYDVISPELQATLAARHPRNSVLLDLPPEAPGDAPGARYRRAAEAFAAWRADGTLRADPEPAIYVYEQTYVLPDSREERRQRGFFAQLRLERYGPPGGIFPHERTLGGPLDDRYALLQATGANFSAMVGLYRSTDGQSDPILAAVAAGVPLTDVRDDDGVRHRLWLVPTGEPGAGGSADLLIGLAGAGPITIADGHHRYETALRYHAGLSARREGGDDGRSAWMLALLFDVAANEMTVLPTHRVVRGAPAGEALLSAAAPFAEVERLGSEAALSAAFPATSARSAEAGAGARIGVWSGGGAAVLRPRPRALDGYIAPGASAQLCDLGVSQLEGLLGAVFGLGPEDLARGERVTYVRDAAAACSLVDRGEGDTAFMLEPIAAATVARIADGGELMPQKSTYFYPKPATGLLFSAAGS